MSKVNFFEIAESFRKGELSHTDERYKKAEALLQEMASTVDGLNALAQVIGVFIDTNFNKFDIAPYIFNYRNFNLGDKPEFRLKKKGITAYFIAPNSSTPKSRNYRETLSMEFDSLSVRPECLLDEITAGRLQGFAELLSDATEAMQNAIVGKVFTILGQVYNATTNTAFYVSDTTSLTKASLDTAIDTVLYKSGQRPVVMGDMMLVNQILEFPGYSQSLLTEIQSTGKIGQYRGASILQLPEVLNPASGAALVPKNRIYVTSSKLGYAGTYGTSKTGQETSMEDWTWNARIDKEWGATVTDPRGMYVIEIV